jgi:hypothetical protein
LSAHPIKDKGVALLSPPKVRKFPPFGDVKICCFRDPNDIVVERVEAERRLWRLGAARVSPKRVGNPWRGEGAFIIFPVTTTTMEVS